ncbi:MAG: response regulator, partial [Gammaproteobacteria bacterium]|nr:response regulator [Gammaproteobacteria bacterium]
MKTVLLTDDNEDIIELVELIISKFGCKLAKAKNGEVAVQYCQESPPDLVIMDLNMPDMDGFTAIESIRIN